MQLPRHSMIKNEIPKTRKSRSKLEMDLPNS
ncbi:hypothetical protein NTHI1209_01084 [Haemophilus influenzae]|uniref:Uncharacterized protein n=1 Tax=Haemophilus influenzae TaxID=727 RepID=A0A158SX83_HAEIF|nr:hypothetical protein NTHI1209_01084 [Haemophilus influenzae]